MKDYVIYQKSRSFFKCMEIMRTPFIEYIPFGCLDFTNPFFDSFKKSYGDYYFRWIEMKIHDKVFAYFDDKTLTALMKLKIEDENESYNEMSVKFLPTKRMKISTFKVDKNDLHLSDRLMLIAIEVAHKNGVNEIYGTIDINLPSRIALVNFIRKYGFYRKCFKTSGKLLEEVWVKDMVLSDDIIKTNFPKHSHIKKKDENIITINQEIICPSNIKWRKNSRV